MGDELVVERSVKLGAIARLPRRKEVDVDGVEHVPAVEVFLELGRGVAGCCVCDMPIPKGASRLMFRVGLRVPVVLPNGSRRVTEKSYAHPGCLTDRIKPEVIRFGLDCYDCGAMPEESDSTGASIHRFDARCFTVSRYSPGRLCQRCTEKTHWALCDICQIHYPPWMISSIVEIPDASIRTTGGYDPGVSANAEATCEFCAQRWAIITTRDNITAKEGFEKLRAEIAEHGFFGAGVE